MQHTSTGRGQSWLTSQASVPDNHAQPLGLTDVSVSKAMMMEIKMRSISDVNLWASHVAKQLQKQKDTADARFSKLKLCPRLYHIMFYHVPVSRNFDVLIDIACLDLHLSGLELLGLRSTTWRRQGTCFLWCRSKWICSEHVSCWEERITTTLMQDSDHVSCIQLWIRMQKKSWPPFCMFKLRKIESACTFSAFSWNRSWTTDWSICFSQVARLLNFLLFLIFQSVAITTFFPTKVANFYATHPSQLDLQTNGAPVLAEHDAPVAPDSLSVKLRLHCIRLPKDFLKILWTCEPLLVANILQVLLGSSKGHALDGLQEMSKGSLVCWEQWQNSLIFPCALASRPVLSHRYSCSASAHMSWTHAVVFAVA